jgi:hypothetical protein
MNWLAWVGIAIGALIVMYAVAMIWLGMGIAEDDFEDGGHR